MPLQISFDSWCRANKLHHKDIIFSTRRENDLCAVPGTACLNVLEMCFWEELEKRVQLKTAFSDHC